MQDIFVGVYVSMICNTSTSIVTAEVCEHVMPVQIVYVKRIEKKRALIG
jgi:hypothetical protein